MALVVLKHLSYANVRQSEFHLLQSFLHLFSLIAFTSPHDQINQLTQCSLAWCQLKSISFVITGTCGFVVTTNDKVEQVQKRTGIHISSIKCNASVFNALRYSMCWCRIYICTFSTGDQHNRCGNPVVIQWIGAVSLGLFHSYNIITDFWEDDNILFLNCFISLVYISEFSGLSLEVAILA
jgi:hypothetical protein